MSLPKSTLVGATVKLRNPEPIDVAARLALGFDPAIVQLFGVDQDAAHRVPALSPLTEATVEQWLDAINVKRRANGPPDRRAKGTPVW
jgi:hypothetical protein